MEWLAVSSLLQVLFAAPRSLPLSLAGEWSVRVEPGTVEIDGRSITVREAAVLAIEPATLVTVTDERLEGLPVFNPQGAPWAKGRPLPGVFTQETSAPGAYEPGSLTVKDAAGEGARVFAEGVDYTIDASWGSLGRIEGGAIAEGLPVFLSYRHGLCRLDSIAVDGEGNLSVVTGVPHINNPRPPALAEGTWRLANVWLEWRIPQLTDDCLFPILEEGYPEPAATTPSVAEQLVPRAVEKLRSSETLRILAWGDSVTVGTYVPDWERNRWQEQLVAQLRARFPGADIELTTVAWGGRNISTFLAEPPGSEYNYQEQVLAKKPDLIISEFVNDAYLDPAGVETQYAQILADFEAIGAEWIILTPHYVRPDWMGLTRQREIDQDPRPYVQGLREFAPRHAVALADASLRWGHLWREGIPYMTYEMNTINHPDERGMKLFADAVMALFPEE